MFLSLDYYWDTVNACVSVGTAPRPPLLSVQLQQAAHQVRVHGDHFVTHTGHIPATRCLTGQALLCGLN